jgi:hypothetical protein
VIIKLHECAPKKGAGLGATLAELHMVAVHKGVSEGTIPPGTLIVLDFERMVAVNGSYIKGTAFWLLKCGQLSCSGNSENIIPPRHTADPRPYDLFVCVSGLSPEVMTEFQEFLKPRGLPLLYAKKFAGGTVNEAIMLGHLDPALRFTLNAMTKQGICTAPQLHELFPDQKITVTAWNNRLNDLHSLRLVRRARVGRGLEYNPITNNIIWV